MSLLLKIKNRLRLVSSSIFDRTLYSFTTHQTNPAPPTFTVYYIGENLPPRMARIVKWLKRFYPIRAVLLCHQDGYAPLFSNNSFDEVLLFRNKWHLLRLLNQQPLPHVVHAFGPKSFYPDVARLFYSGKAKFIYDMQDVLAIYYGLQAPIQWFRNEFPHEKNCLQFADGLVSHGLEPIPASKLYHISQKKNRIFFPLLCDDDVLVNNPKPLTLENISVVYAGEIQGKNRDSKQFGNVQFFHLAEKFGAQKVHFHVYATPHSYLLYGDEYREVEKQNPYFHLHAPVAQKDLPAELSKYHFGIIPFFESYTALRHDKNYYSTSLKLFNFIEAGIPILVSEDIGFQNWMACRYSAGISITEADLSSIRQKIETIDYPALIKGLIQSRPKLSLKNNIYRIKNLYDKVCAQ
ncbi:MAG: hypothetical protein U0T73_03085 [Chitinophagales bacterium]